MSSQPWSKDSPERREKILSFLRAGHSLNIAAAKAGITYQTLNQWRKADKDFADQCDAAEGEGIGPIETAVVDMAKGGDFQASKFILERRKPTRDQYKPAEHNLPGLAIQNNYFNPLGKLNPLLSTVERKDVIAIEAQVVDP